MPESDLQLLKDAARESGAIAQRFWRNAPETWEKSDDAGPVTEADIAIDKLLQKRLRSERPEYGWLSEESSDSQARLSTKRQFVVDPIDGTRAFIAGEKTFAHSLAIIEDGIAISGAVYLPVLDLMFTAERGKGAFLNGQPIQTNHAPLEGANVLGARPNFEAKHWKDDVAPPVKRHFRTSLAYRLCLVAQGRFDAMITLRDTWEWDVAAGAVIAAESGAFVTDTKGRPPVFNNPHPKLRGMLAAGPDVHDGLLSRLKSS